jgi:flagellar motor switch protein FliN/FliY
MSPVTSPPPAMPAGGPSFSPSVSATSDASAGLSRGIDSLGFVMDVPVEVTVELGRRRVRIGEVLRLGPGSVLELSKSNGEPLDIYVNDRLIARGEAVVVGERYGVRLTEVLVVDPGFHGGGTP